MSDIAYLEMQQEVAQMCKMSLDDATQLAQIKRWLNIAQEDINSRATWPWLESREIVQTVADKSDGTVSIAASGTTATGTSTAFASSDVGSYIQFSSSNDWYKILTVTSTISLTIEKPYVGSTALTDGTYTIRKVYYSLSSSVDKVLTIRQATTPIKMSTFNYRMFDLYIPDITATGSPEACMMFGMDSSRNWQFFLHPIPDEVLNLEIRTRLRSTDMSADDSYSNIPAKWAKTVLIAGAIWRGMEFNRASREDIRADKWYGIYERGIERMLADISVSEDEHHVLQSNEVSSREAEIRYPENYDAS
jgi:hypothetical protein